MDLMTMDRVGDRWEKMEGSCSTGQSPQWAVVPVEEEEEEEEEVYSNPLHVSSNLVLIIRRINCINTTSGMCHSV
jgi:hypothetical protein